MSESASTDPASLAGTPAQPTAKREMTLREVLEIAQQLQRNERLDEAEDLYLQLLRQLPYEPNVMNYLGVLRHQQGRQEEALALLARSAMQSPDAPGPWINFANVLIETGHYDDAVRALNNAIAIAPDAVMPYNNLGILHSRRGEFAEAEAALKRALALGPKQSYVHYNLANLYYRRGRMKECTDHSLRSIAYGPKNPQARALLSRSQFMVGEHDEAIETLRDWQGADPSDPEPLHYLAALGVGDVPERASDAYVTKVFDRFSASFEMKLELLGYRGPQLVCDELQRLRGGLPAQAVVLDAGCGTGLCGPLLRLLASRLEGVDLSPGMLRRAEGRHCYDQLHQAELTAFLESHAGAYDAIVSADVFIYFGSLDALLLGMATALRPGGVLAATVEALPDDEAQDYRLEVHGRYAHHERYLKALLARHGLQLDAIDNQVLRNELAAPVHGWVFSAVKVA